MLEVPSVVLEALERRASLEGKTLEELAVEAVLNYCGISDPEVKAEVHVKLCEKYLREGEELLAKEEYAQASEKFWGSASQAVKALAARRGLELRSWRTPLPYSRAGGGERRPGDQEATAISWNATPELLRELAPTRNCRGKR